MEIFRRFDVFRTLQIDEETCKNWFILIEANYELKNSYHNSTHGADVLQASSYFLQKMVGKGGQSFDNLDEACVLIASAVHDVGHPGKSASFLVNSDNPLAILYNDITVLESHHAALTFKLTLGEPECNIFQNLDRNTYREIRPKVIDMVIATDMTKHFDHLANFIEVFGYPRNLEKTTKDVIECVLRRMLIKCADVSSPLRTMRLTMEWAVRITIEYLQQTEEEKANKLPVTLPTFDRDSYSVPRCQVSFFEFVILQMMEAWDDFLNIPELMRNMKRNYEDWKRFEFHGLHSLEDIQQKQEYLKQDRTSE
jgi:high affinity cAMP-specific and IBMX-insensitive 3',5'-cyclic phosphodiesterase 8